jgi:hypothetical protein
MNGQARHFRSGGCDGDLWLAGEWPRCIWDGVTTAIVDHPRSPNSPEAAKSGGPIKKRRRRKKHQFSMSFVA